MPFHYNYRFRKYSQHDEDGLLREIIRRINPVKTCCEFGAADGKMYSNTFLLVEQGWKGLFIEENPEKEPKLSDNIKDWNAEYVISKVSKENINDLIPSRMGVLSIDVDNDDYHLWKAYTGKADIVIIEINSGIIPPREEVPGNSGASYTSMLKLAIQKGYFLISHTGNMVFVQNRYRPLFPELKGDGHNWNEYFDTQLV